MNSESRSAADSMSAPARAVDAVIRAYQRYVSPLFAPHCRFHPTCSGYAREALRVHGLWRGGGLALWRILRCQPFSAGGFDPVPEAHRSHREPGTE